MKKIILFLISLLLVSGLNAADNYVPSKIFSRVNSGNMKMADSENLKLWRIEQIIVGFEDGTKIVGNWTVVSRIGLGGAIPAGWTLDASELYYYASQTITFDADGTYTTDSHNLYIPAYVGTDTGKWKVEGNQFVVMSDADIVNGMRSYRSPIIKISNYEWSSTVSKTQAGLYFSKPNVPPRVPLNASISGDDLVWEDNSDNEDGFYIHIGYQTFDEATGWSIITWQPSVTVSTDAIDCPLIDLGLQATGRNLIRVQSFRDVGGTIIPSIGRSNVVVYTP